MNKVLTDLIKLSKNREKGIIQLKLSRLAEIEVLTLTETVTYLHSLLIEELTGRLK